MQRWIKYTKHFVLLFLLIITAGLVSAQRTDSLRKKNLSGNTSIQEDIHRYMGYESPLPFRYLSLPYDVAMTANLRTFTVEVGFFLLLLLPLVFLLSISPPRSLLGVWVLFLILVLTISLPSSYLNQFNLEPEEGISHIDKRLDMASGSLEAVRYNIHLAFMHVYVPLNKIVSEISGEKDYVTYPILLVLLGGILLLLHFRLSQNRAEEKGLLLFFILYGSLWFLLSSGLPWYGFMLFALGSLWVVYGWVKKREQALLPLKIQRIALYAMVGLWVAVSLPLKMANYTPGGKTVEAKTDAAKRVFFQPLAMYRNGDFTGEEVLGLFRSGYPQALKAINQETSSLVYQVGTLMPFYIKKNDARIIYDPFLGFGAALIKKYPDKKELIQVLKASGVRYMVIDLKLPQVDKTPGKTLSRKFDDFINVFYKNPLVELVATDRSVRMNENGQVVPAVFFNQGKVVKAGSFALYRIK